MTKNELYIAFIRINREHVFISKFSVKRQKEYRAVIEGTFAYAAFCLRCACAELGNNILKAGRELYDN